MNIRDYMHYYVGQTFDYPSCGTRHKRVLNGYYLENPLNEMRLHLRPLDSMTEEEAKELVCMELGKYERDQYKFISISPTYIEYSCGITAKYDSIFGPPEPVENIQCTRFWQLSPQQFHHLLSRGFDLFGFIESGAAVDVKTIN